MPAAALLGTMLSFLPHRAPRTIARRLTIRANAARDARNWQAAAALYEEALRLAPTARIHKQCGHMYKEAGDYAAAERQYRAAERLQPRDADLALQSGHMYKLAGRPEDAARAFAHAAELQPGWGEALDELARVRSTAPSGTDGIADTTSLAPELLPGGEEAPRSYRETLQIRRLGMARVRGPTGERRVLRGVEAIRGFCVAAIPLDELLLLIDDEIVARHPLEPLSLPGSPLFKHPFNLWHDFSAVARGERRIELRLVDAGGRKRVHRAILPVIDPATEADLPEADAIVDPPPPDTASLTGWIDGRPSMVRPARRSPLPRDVRAILVQRADQLGDLAVSVPALERLRALFPEARITLLATPANAFLAETLACVDEVVVAPLLEEHGRRVLPLAAQQALRQRLARTAFDVAIDFGEGADSRPLLRLAAARFTYGFKDREAPWLSAGFEFNARDAANGLFALSPARKLLGMVESLGVLARDEIGAARRPPAGEPAAHGLALAPGQRFVVLHSGARLAYTRWPHFTALAALLLERTDLVVVSMDDGEPLPLAPHPRLRTVSGKLPFARFDALLSGCAAFVGNDSGPKHLAAMRGAPVVSLHMARLNWNEWGQEGSGLIVSRRVPCAGCAIDRDADECARGFACLVNITAEEVFDAATRLMRGSVGG